MIQKRVLMAVALPAAVAAARFAAKTLRSKGKSTLADRIEQVVEMVSPSKQQKKR